MINQPPTKQQEEKFWEKHGFKWEKRAVVRLPGAPFDSMGGWRYPDSIDHGYLPPIDLNSLFKWAVPKLGKDRMSLLAKWIRQVVDGQNPALALYWVLDKVREVE